MIVGCRERQFVVSFFMVDDSVSVFEQRQDGFPGGKFLERGTIRRSGGALGDNLNDKDFFVGATLLLHQHAFELTRYHQRFSTLKAQCHFPMASPCCSSKI